MPTTRRKSTPRQQRPSGVASREAAAIVWSLKLDGDINEGWMGGDARKTLLERLAAKGIKLTKTQLNNRLYYMRDKKWITIIAKGRTAYHIRLVGMPPMDKYPNPFETETTHIHPPAKVQKPEIVPALTSDHVTLNGYKALSLQDRMALLDELDNAAKLVRESIKGDLNLAQDLFGSKVGS